MKKSILVTLILILGLLLSACGPETGDMVPIKFRHTMSPGSTVEPPQPWLAYVSQSSPLVLSLPRA